ncbi:MAG: chitobiase/beta-hexosaminidase C-terminal domain-containing protein, partial [Deltaproteobacteria bacterium]
QSYGVYVTGGYAYLADFGSGLAIIDVSDPANPGTPVYRDTGGGSYGVYVTGGYAYVADENNDLAIVDVSDPANPGTPVYYTTPGWAYGVYVTGGYAYLADYDGLRIVDISSFNSPVFTAVAVDNCGIASGPATVNVTIDVTPPISRAIPSGGVYTSAVTVTLTATDDQDPSPDIFYDVNETGSFDPYVGPILISTTTTLEFYAVDDCGNEEPVNREVYTFSGCIIGITTPAPGDCINTMTVPVTGTFGGFVGAVEVDVFVNGVTAVVDPPGATNSGSYTVTILFPEGLGQTITAVASNGSCTNIASITVDVDFTPPDVLITSPADGATLCTTTIVIVGSCIDPAPGSGIATCVIEVDGTTGDMSDGNETIIVPGTGVYTATLTGVDNCGNGATTTISFEVDVTPPTVDITSPADGATFCTTTVVILGNCNDVGFGVSTCVVAVTGGLGGDMSDGNETIIVPGSGTYTATLTGIDSCGLGASTTISFEVDVTPPTVDITSPADGATFCTTTVVILGNCNDVGFGVSTCVVAVTGGLGGDMSDGNETIIVPGSGTYTA